ncbi:MAG: TIGR03085 family metal-binding protein [Ornithinimicrobium sp.]
MNLAQHHRQAFCDAAEAAGPQAPTLCEGWTVADLVAHVVVRDGRPDALVGMILPPAEAHGEAVRRAFASSPFPELLDRARSGPPRWSPARLPSVDDAMNVVEFVVHREDIVRADPDWTTDASDEVDRESAEATWSALRRIGRLLYRGAPTGVVLRVPRLGRAVMRRPSRGQRSVVLTGPAVDLLLHAFGRTSHARVEVSGDASDVAAFSTTPLEV